MRKKTWPTPTATDYKGGVSIGAWGGYDMKKTEKRKSVLRNAVVWPTPVASEARQGFQDRSRGKKGTQESLSTVVRKITYPTPGTTGLSNGSGNCGKANELFEQGVISEEERRSFRAGNGGQLNPGWTEWLMGWPVGWTSLEPMRKEGFEEWEEKAIKGQLWTVDPADLSPDDPAYIPRVTDEKTHRKERLMALGNGQVPSCVCLAESVLEAV